MTQKLIYTMEKKMNHKERMVSALRAQYEAEMEVAKTNFLVYIEHPCAVGEHIDIVESASNLVKNYESAKSKLEALEELKDYTNVS